MNVSASTSGTATPRSRIDALSRDDLLRFVKKQIDKLKAAKSENEECKNELAELHKKCTENEERWRVEQEANKEKAEELEVFREKYKDLELECSNLTSQLNELKAQLEQDQGADEKITSNTGSHSEVGNIRELQNELASVKDLLREQTDKYDKEVEEKERLTCTVAELRSLLDDAYLQLESLKEKRSVENVMTLEMADFEKTVERLQKELKAATDEKLSMRSELEASMKDLENSREERTHLTSNITKLKAALRKMRNEIEEKKEEFVACEKEKKILEEKIEKQFSARNEEREQLTTVIGVNEEKISELEATNASLSRQLMSLRSQRESLQRQYDDLSQEYQSFKTRALYVLEQKKSENDEHSKGEIEMLEETVRQQKRTIDNLTNSHRMLQGELDSALGHTRTLSTELSSLQRQLATATEAHQRELAEQRQQLESRLASETKLNSELLVQIDANFVAHNQEKESLLSIARQERESLAKEVEHLKRAVDEETRRRKEAERMQAALAASDVAIQLHKPSTDNLPINSSYLKRPTSAVGKADEVKSNASEDKYVEKTLEEVIYGDDEEENIIDIWDQPDNPSLWQKTAHTTMKQLEHTRELLNESEATNARLLEQTKLLKDEIRRMERNMERENHLANTEYLKNVIMKFIAPQKVSDERGQLVPVLETMLKLSSDEVKLLNQVAQADSAATNTSKTTTWGAYLWSGLS